MSTSLPLGGKTALVTGGSRSIGAAIGKQRYGKPAEIASVVASPQAAFVTGAEIVADGGFTA